MNGSFASHFRLHMEVLAYICVSLSDWLLSVRSSLGPFMLLQMALFHSFSWLGNMTFCMCPILKAVKKKTLPQSVNLPKRISALSSFICLLTQLMFSFLMENNCLWERMNKGKDNHWYASISRDYFKASFITDVSAKGKFDINVLVMCFHFGYLLSSGALPVSMTFSIFSFGIPLSLFSSW